MANTLTSHQATVVGNEALLYLRKNTVMPRLVTNVKGGDAASKGSVIKVPKIGSLTTNAKVAGNAVTVQNATSTDVSITLNQHREVTFIVEDIDKALSDGNIQALYMDAAMSAICEKVDADLCGLYTGLSQTVPGTANLTPLTAALITAGRTQLSTAKAPLARRSMVLGAEAYAQVLTLPEFVSADKYGSATPIQEGSLGRILGFDVFESQSIVTATADQNLMFQARAFGIAFRPLALDAPTGGNVIQEIVTDPLSGLSVRVTMWYNAGVLGTQCTIDVLYGFAELDDALATKLLS